MKRTGHKPSRARPQTLADLIATVAKIAQNDRLTAHIVADMINSQRVHLEGRYHGQRVIVG